MVLLIDVTSNGAIDGDCLSPGSVIPRRCPRDPVGSPRLWRGPAVAPVPHAAGREQLAAIGWDRAKGSDLDVERRAAGAAAGGGLCTAAAAADFASRFQKSMVSSLMPASVLTLSE